MKLKIIAASITLLMLGACGTMEAAKMKAKSAVSGVTATECFTAGGTIDSSKGAAMCKMKDGSTKPVK